MDTEFKQLTMHADKIYGMYPVPPVAWGVLQLDQHSGVNASNNMNDIKDVMSVN